MGNSKVDDLWNKETTDLFLQARDVAQLLGVSNQGVYHICDNLGLKTKYGKNNTRKIYPHEFNEILSHKFGNIKKPKSKISIHSVKGGPGKTTLTHAIGTRASCFGYKVLLVDLDKQANLTNSFGIDDEKEEVISIYDLFEESSKGVVDKELLKASVIKMTDYLSILPSNISMSLLEGELIAKKLNPVRFIKQIFKRLEPDYDVIIFDFPPDFNYITHACHAFCNKALIPVPMNKFSLKGIELTIDHLENLRIEYDIDIQKLVVVNKVDNRSSTTHEYIQVLLKKYPDFLSPIFIRNCKALEDVFLKESCMWKESKAKPALEGLDDLSKSVIEIEKIINPKTSSKKKSRVAKKERSRNV